MLTPTLTTIAHVFQKMERESYRMFHAENPVNKADHLYNFCVTGHSLRDHFFLAKQIRKVDQPAFHESWNLSPEVRAVADIANTAKHLQLDRQPPKTKSTTPTRSPIVKIFDNGSRLTSVHDDMPDFEITLQDGSKVLTYDFVKEVARYWHLFLTAHGFQIERQSDEDLWGVGRND